MTLVSGKIILEAGACRDLSGYRLRRILLHFRTLRIDAGGRDMLWADVWTPASTLWRAIGSAGTCSIGPCCFPK